MKVFGDSGWFLAIHNKRDIHHEEALRILQKIIEKKIQVYTSDYVVDESVTLALARTKSHDTAEALGEGILRSRYVKLLKISEDNFWDAWEFFKEHKHKFYSFTDCTTFILMHEYKIDRAFTYDDHFKREGFRVNFE
ncbi:MAG: hypothetical protein A7316_06320 [Candidatus Altiarchaeales archaeon WOR_SM1_86-2]|nr:MAG: hypothetical protein A7316_06320 [Candidatus Altiarchaeales archaeon WOR_SM1_86-2]ODS40413.1 MAG: hypothetical protein A7315_08630 [Candidatus Altiarchaeales archaeon WOR_SM1_79]